MRRSRRSIHHWGWLLLAATLWQGACQRRPTAAIEGANDKPFSPAAAPAITAADPAPVETEKTNNGDSEESLVSREALEATIKRLKGTWVETPGVSGEPRGRGKQFKPQNLKALAPARFKVKFTTSKGPFVVEATRSLAPKGADRFYNLVRAGYYDNIRFHRVIKGAFVQFGIHGDPNVNHALINAEIPDDEP